jgi:hypothetical protein
VTHTPAHRLQLGWEIAQGFGLLAALCALLLCLVPIRPRRLGTGTVSVHRHELLGWLMLAGVAAHVALALVVDRTAREHLRLTAPLYEWAGICAALACLVLTLPATDAVRPHLWSRHRNFQLLHVGVSCALLWLIAAHVMTTARLVHGPVRMALYLALSLTALAALLRSRRNAQREFAAGLNSRLVFGRHSRVMLGIVIIAALAAVPLLSAGTRLLLREPLEARAEAPALDFPHDKHREVNCLLCHHNFADQTGTGSCISCHRSQLPAIRVGAEARFHDFCLGCHRDPPPPLAHHGPVTGCDSCHAPP